MATYKQTRHILVTQNLAFLIPNFFHQDTPGIASRPLEGCPYGTRGCNDAGCSNTCFCEKEDHCSWKKCKLDEPPHDCLKGTNSKWTKDNKIMYWVANLQGMIII